MQVGLEEVRVDAYVDGLKAAATGETECGVLVFFFQRRIIPTL
jgi:hypothetical protein